MDYRDMASSLAATLSNTRATLMPKPEVNMDLLATSMRINTAGPEEPIVLLIGSRKLDPSEYEEWVLAGRCLALRKPEHAPTDMRYFQLWVDWSRQKGNVANVPAMVELWETYRPTPRQISNNNSKIQSMLAQPDPRESVTLKMKRLDEAAIVPTFGTEGAACFDLYAICEFGDAEAYINSTEHPNVTVETGWAFEVPVGWVMKVYSRSGQGFKDNTRLANCVGIIDSDYRGPLRVKLTRDDGETLFVRHGDRVAQAMLERVPVVTFEEVEQLSSTTRGDGAYGSTGR